MMYANVADLQRRYGERDLRLMTDPHAQALDAGRAQQALDDACAEMDTWLARRYVLPLVAQDGHAVPLPLVRCACDIAIYRLQTLRPADDIKDARLRYEDTMRLLKALASGEVSLPGMKLRGDVADAPASQSAGVAQFAQPPSLFGRGNR